MNEFDLRNFLYKNPLLEGEEADDKAKKALDKQEDALDEKDMENETLKDKIKHHEGAIENISKELDDLKDDLGEDKEDLEKEKEEMKEEKYYEDVEEATKPSKLKFLLNDFKDEIYLIKQQMGKDADKVLSILGLKKEDVKEDKKLTKEGLKDMIRERITSILNEETVDEGNNYYEDVTEAEEEKIEKNTDVEVKDDTTVKADIEKEVDIDDESSKAEMEIDGEIAGESSDKAAVLSLLTKAQELVPTLGGDQEQNDKMVQQVNNTITMFARDYLASTPE
jgi:hypothetical protein